MVTTPMQMSEDAAILFQQDWQLYRKMVDNNFLFHREAYARLHEALSEREVAFRFLDIACGDASASVTALTGTRIASYHGIDRSSVALAMAAEALRPLGCPVQLEEGDFTEVLPRWRDPVDVAWVGLSLHHLGVAGKLAILGEIRRIVGGGGELLIFENTSPDGESRDAWLDRWDLQRPDWSAYSDAEFERMAAHVHSSDFPETDSTWRRLGAEAGFASVEELYRTPTDLFRLYRFQ